MDKPHLLAIVRHISRLFTRLCSMCAVPTHDDNIVRSTDIDSAESTVSSNHEDVATAIAAALEAINAVMEWKREEVSAQERIVEQLKRGVDEDLPDGLLASVNQAETVMKTALREMRWNVDSFKKVLDLPDQLASQLAVVDKSIKTLTKMERSLTPLILEETRYRNPQRLPRDGRYA
ncbi:hypothetical protein PRIPAC_96607 [Pristionchus pacificus]|uniref:Uncharacterized protein n=1 Tax=Pristionchus pacificus TaxID=54126 RepID=A0A2A6B3D7_PRIPA|nr:hypothetical protein PRIPAC_96607 [Pristionchus pacificus]|eukprot:PDM60371.1 hypothetical protein PRIPAC_54196 [Pristionchus pacificus]